MAFGEGARRAYEPIGRLRGRWLGVYGEGFQDEMLREGHVPWKCRAGARFFHVCDQGLVHLCDPRFGDAPKPLADYREADLRGAFDARKRCATRCAVAYAHMVSRVDRFRARRDGASDAASP